MGPSVLRYYVFGEVLMKSKPFYGFLAAALALAASPVLGLAQHVGLQVGIAQPQVGFQTPQAPAIAVRSTFSGTPIIVIPAPQPIVPIAPFPFIPLGPNFPTVIVPNQVLVPGQTFLPSPFIPTPFVSSSPVPFVPPPVRRVPIAGTPRADVLRQFGPPSVTVITSSGETLYFTGGVTVIIQNGQVVGPR